MNSSKWSQRLESGCKLGMFGGSLKLVQVVGSSLKLRERQHMNIPLESLHFKTCQCESTNLSARFHQFTSRRTVKPLLESRN